MQVDVLPILKDNYGFVLSHEGHAVVVDPGEAGPLIRFLKEKNLQLDAIWNTHEHADHVDGNAAILQAFGPVPVIGSKGDRGKVAELTQFVGEGDRFTWAGSEVQVFDVAGHTRGHIAFLVEGHLFAGDLLFGLGCGRVFDPALMDTMHQSVSKLLKLPDSTRVYCGHEYTAGNYKWALHVEPDNAELKARVDTERPPTVPLDLGLEKRTNSFLRLDAPAVQKFTGETEPAAVFRVLRERKNSF